MHNPITTDIPARPPWLRWTTAIAAAAVMAIAAIQLARVDADLGAPFGPDRIVHALDASPALASTDAAQARLALRDRPVDGAAYRVLAQAEDAVGHADRAGALYATAVARWPRDRIARAELADRAFAGEDIEAGLTHLDALLRVAPELRAAVLASLMPYLGDPRIAAGLLARLAANPPWRDAVPAALLAATPPTAPTAPAAPTATATAPTTAPATATAEALLATLATRIPPTPAELQARMTLLDRLGRPAQARAIWLTTLAPDDRAAAGLVFDGGFERPGVVDGYAWQLSAPPGAAIGYAAAGAYQGQSALAIGFDGRAVQFAGVRQRLALPAGRYRLQLAARNRVDTARPFVWRVACDAGSPAPLAELPVPVTGAGQWQTIAVAFEVPPACASQSLQLHHTARSLAEQRLAGDLLFDAVLISRAH